MKFSKWSLLGFAVSAPFVFQSCCTPAYQAPQAYGCGLPIAVTETHTKTSQPASFSMPYVPPASVYQAPPMAVAQPVQAPVCQPMQYAQPVQAPICQPAYQATPVCPPTPTYQATPCQPVQAYQNPCQPYQSDPCAPQYAPSNIRYNHVGVGYATQQPQYIVVQPNPVNASQPMHVNSPKPISSGDDCH